MMESADRGSTPMKDANLDTGCTERARDLMRKGPVKPEWILFDGILTLDEKRWMLRQLIADIEAELRASEENMNRAGQGDAGERLRIAQEALASIR